MEGTENNGRFELSDEYKFSPGAVFCMMAEPLWGRNDLPDKVFYLLDRHGFSKVCSTRLDYVSCLIAEHYRRQGFAVTGFQIRQLMVQCAWKCLRDADVYIDKASYVLNVNNTFPFENLESESEV